MDNSLSHLMSWTESTKGDVPPPLTGPSITLSPLSSHPPTIFVFGGKYVQTRRLTNEMWALDIGSKTWTRLDTGDGPAPRYFHTMDTWEDKLVCFGGMSDAEPISVYGDMYFFDCATRRWLPPPSPSPGIAQDPVLLPSPRYAHLSAASRGKLVITGGQHADNTFLFEINIYDLRRRVWLSKTHQPEIQGLHSKGAYRSVAISSKIRVITPPKGGDNKGSSASSYTIDEEGEGGEIWAYSNYDFAKVRRELDIIAPADLDIELIPSSKYNSPPGFSIRDDSRLMRGSTQPPGLRFPTGGVIGNHLILCGLYLASTAAAFSVWVMDLTTMTWRHIEPAALSCGSWNRAVLWQDGAKLIVFGSLDNDLSADYGKRAVNLEHIAIVSLETYGLYQPPLLEIPSKIQEMGLSMLDEKLASDFSVICDDGRKIKCSRKLLSERWTWFAEEERKLAKLSDEIMADSPSVDINDTLLGSFTRAQLSSTSLTIPEPFPVCVALVQYFYTLSLSTPLQNRAPILSALLFLAKQYKIDRLARLVVHSLHERLEPNVAVGVYEIATLSGEQNLQIRALSMIHAGRNGSTAKSQRQGPPGSVIPDAPQTTSPPTTGPNASTAASSDNGTQPQGRVDDSNFRRARAESITLAPEEADKVTALLAPLDVSEPARPESPTERAIPRIRPRAITNPPSRPPPTRSLPQPDLPELDQSSSPPTSTSSSMPHTPREALRESYILPPGSHPMWRGGSSHSNHLETLDEIEDDRSSRRHFQLAPSTLETAGLIPHSRLAPPSAFTSHQAHAINAQLAARDYAYDAASQYSTSSHCPSLTSASTATTSPMAHGHSRSSVQSHSSDSSMPSMHKTRLSVDMSDSPTYADFNINFDVHGSFDGSTLSRTGTMVSSHRDAMSISSGSTGASSKQMAKLEKKMIIQAEKDAKKSESQARFEALRSDQQKKMAISRARAQREAEVEAAKPIQPKPQPKSKFGKFGAKLTGAVLFPEGGKNSTMF